jgi:ribonuclease HII
MLPLTIDGMPENEVYACMDEVGRGSLIGPVVAAVVIWDKTFTPKNDEEQAMLDMINDSKKISAKKREKLAEFIQSHALEYAIGSVDNGVIDEINILQATFKAMHNALEQLQSPFERILVDGNRFKAYLNKSGEFVPHVCVREGDAKVFGIACASIIAKVWRDKWVTDLYNSDESLHVYGLNKNKGYGTKQHMDAIRQHGITAYHRKTFVHI